MTDATSPTDDRDGHDHSGGRDGLDSPGIDDPRGVHDPRGDRAVPDAFEVPDGESPAAVCDRCGQPFADERLHALHLGEVHDDRLTDDERERVEGARAEESDDLFWFHLRVVAVLVAVYTVYVLTYMAVLAARSAAAG